MGGYQSNPKFEARNPKEAQIPNDQTKELSAQAEFLYMSLGRWDLFRISILELRVSNLSQPAVILE
jgi:hypothetical protein